MSIFFKITILTIILTVLFFPLKGVFARDIEDRTFALNEAIEMAIANNTLIQEAIENQKAAIEEEKIRRKESLPKASASYSYSRLKETPFGVFGFSEFDIGQRDNVHWDVMIQQPLFTGFALSTKRKMAKLGIEMKGKEKEQVLLDVIKQVKAYYFNILFAKKFLMVADRAVYQLGSHAKDADNFYENGMIPYNDVLKSKVALADAEQTRVKAESRVEMSISAFNTLLGIDIDMRTEVEDVLEVQPSFFTLKDLFEEAQRKRPELKILQLGIKNSEYSIKLARSSYYPQIALIGGYERDGDNPSANNNDFGNNHNASITLQAKWTFFEWGKKGNEVQKQRYQKLSLTQKIKGVEDSIRLEVKDAFLNLNVSEQNIKTAKESLTQAKENYRITNLQYQQQMTTSTEVLDARTFLTEAETNYYSALYGYMISLAELERAVGRRKSWNVE